MQGWFNIHKSINEIQPINSSKDKNHMSPSVDTEKSFDKIQHPFMIKALKKLGIEGMFHKIIKAVYNKLRAHIITKWRITETIPVKVRNETRLSAFSTLIQYGFGNPSQAIRQEKK
jgi:hypothetical protein